MLIFSDLILSCSHYSMPQFTVATLNNVYSKCNSPYFIKALQGFQMGTLDCGRLLFLRVFEIWGWNSTVLFMALKKIYDAVHEVEKNKLSLPVCLCVRYFVWLVYIPLRRPQYVRLPNIYNMT